MKKLHQRLPRVATNTMAAMALSLGWGVGSVLPSVALAAEPPPLASLSQVNVARYMGQWYQVALFPNRFQAQCVSDTTATYRELPGGKVEVLNRCRMANGQMDDVLGVARPVGRVEAGELKPAQLQVTFLPAWLRWTGIGWGDYWVVQLAPDYRYAVISEPSRKFLWVLSRSPKLSAEDEAAIRQTLQAQGFDLRQLQNHPHQPAP